MQEACLQMSSGEQADTYSTRQRGSSSQQLLRSLISQQQKAIMAESVTVTCVSPCIDAEIAAELKVVSEKAIGKDLVFKLTVTNLTTDAKDVMADIKASAIIYTRKEINELIKDTRKISLDGCEVKDEAITITYAQYDGLLTPDNAVEVTVVCSSAPIQGTLILQTNVILDNPKFDIKLKGPACVDQPVTAEIVFTNPLDQDVSDIVVTAEGSGLFKDPYSVKEEKTVKPNETITIPVTMTPYKSGCKHMLVDLTTNKFKNEKGYIEIKVCDPKEPNK